jgi:hypothetical protein
LKKIKSKPPKAPKAKDFITDAVIFQVLVSNLSDITLLFRTASELDFTHKYMIVTEYDPARGVAYLSNDFVARSKESTKEILSLCANELLNAANIAGSVVEET